MQENEVVRFGDLDDRIKVTNWKQNITSITEQLKNGKEGSIF